MRGSARYSWNANRRWQIGRVLFAALVLATWGSMLFARVPRAQKHERRHEIDHLEDAWRDALLKEDTAAMSGLLADDYMAITPNGTLQTKEEALANLRSGHVHFTTLEISDRKVRFYGSTALVTSTADVQGSTPEGNVSGSYRYTRVYVEGPPGVWKIVSFEANRILGPGYRAHK
jgi:ketosteroid isomerase-like protein